MQNSRNHGIAWSKLSHSFLTLALLAPVSPSPRAVEKSSEEYPSEVMVALEAADDNRVELEKVLAHYASDADSLKLQAAYFLITNMEGHSYVTYVLCDSTGAEIPFNVLDYPDFDSLMVALDSLEVLHGEMDFQKKETVEDAKSVSADFLINQIDYAFLAWREKPWAKQLSFEQFCEYVLPYRGSNEPLEPWRKVFWEKYRGIEQEVADTSDPVQVAALINDDLKSWFRFDPRYYLHPTDQGLAEMLDQRLGRCEDMTNLTIYAMRANGLAVTSDYTPYWANSGNNHAWNAIVAADGRAIPFMGAEANPGTYHLANKFAKVYRKMFAQQKGNLIFQERKQSDVPRWLSGKNYVDVTKDYTSVVDVRVEFDRPVPDSVDIAYICVFNSGEWQPIHWGRIKGAATVFDDMAPDIVYLPALYIDEKIVPFGWPFVLAANGSRCELRPDAEKMISIGLISTTKRQQEVSTDGIAKTYLKTGETYELFCWREDWQSLGSKSAAGNEPLVFDNVPAGCLYWLVEKGSDREERIFTIEEGQQVWW